LTSGSRSFKDSSLKVSKLVPFDSLHMVSCYTASYSNVISKMHRFWDIWLWESTVATGLKT